MRWGHWRGETWIGAMATSSWNMRARPRVTVDWSSAKQPSALCCVSRRGDCAGSVKGAWLLALTQPRRSSACPAGLIYGTSKSHSTEHWKRQALYTITPTNATYWPACATPTPRHPSLNLQISAPRSMSSPYRWGLASAWSTSTTAMTACWTTGRNCEGET